MVDCTRPERLSSLRDTASNLTVYDILLLINFKSGNYVEILTRLGGAVRRQRPERERQLVLTS
jgi:hypothetical protein